MHASTPSPTKRPRIALFQSFWRLHSSTLYAARSLAEAGYHVDLFLFNVDTSIPMNFLSGVDGVSIRSLDAKSNVKSRVVRRLLAFAYNAMRWPLDHLLFLMRSTSGLVPRRIVERTVEMMDGERYVALIGIEKGGLIWASAVEQRQAAPLIYSSLELYTWGHPLVKDIRSRRMKAAEEPAHNRCRATIVQDPLRGMVLCEDNQVTHDMRMLYVPISRWGDSAVIDDSSWRNELGIGRETIVILCHGVIAERRLCMELTQIAQYFPEDWLLVFHGWGEQKVIQKIRNADRKKRVRISSRLVEMSEEHKVVGSADISLVLYKNEPQNDRLTGFSSEKLALSLQCGVPVIAFNYPTYEHIANEGCGVLVEDLSEIPKAIMKIMGDRLQFRSQAIESFRRHYSFERNFQTVLDALNDLCASRSG
jgi:glycosyltransferase involved in cell wall biosynthesis